jgi:hypothetical protein
MNKKMKKTNGNQSIHNQPLSELQKSILSTSYEHRCRASLVQVRDAYYGAGLSELEQERARAAICRAKRALILRGLIEPVPKIIVLTSPGWGIADALVLAQTNAPGVIATLVDLARHRRAMEANRRYEESMRLNVRRFVYRPGGGRRVRRPLVNLDDYTPAYIEEEAPTIYDDCKDPQAAAQ